MGTERSNFIGKELKMTKLINGKEIYLKRLTPKDVSVQYVSWLNDTNINRFLECRFAEHTYESVKKYIHDIGKEDSNELIFGIYTSKDSKHIGNIKLGPINKHHLHAAIGLVIGDKVRGGLVTDLRQLSFFLIMHSMSSHWNH